MALGSARRHFERCGSAPAPPLAVAGKVCDRHVLDGSDLARTWILLAAAKEHRQVAPRQWA